MITWFSLSVSLFNAILLIWLGLTVLLSAEQRGWAIGAAGGSLLLGGGFFISHTAIIGRGVLSYDISSVIWWAGGLIPAVLLPYAWLAIMRWYAGIGDAGVRQRRRQKVGITITTALLAGGVLIAGMLLILFFVPLALEGRVLSPRSSIPGFSGLALLLTLVYSGYLLLCMGLALDALRNPGPSARTFGEMARRRARPWLIAVTVGLLLVGLIVSAVMLYTVLQLRTTLFIDFYIQEMERVLVVDAVVAALLAGVVLLLGQAIVTYEIFTGKTLPRRELLRHWQGAVLLAGGYSVLIGGVFARDVRLIYALLLTTTLMIVFYALFSWRSFAAQERLIDNLRPFVAGPRLYEQMLSGATELPAPVDERPLATLCREILSTDFGLLLPLGPAATLVNEPLVYPADRPVPPLLDLSTLLPHFTTAETSCVPLAPGIVGEGAWAVPLWRESALIGVLLLGSKRGGGLYTQEAIEIARTSGERLLDLLTSGELARRLMAIQRRRMVESQVVDRRARRVLHDDVLPLLHTALLHLGRADLDDESRREVVELLGMAHGQISDLLRQMPTGAAPEIGRLGLLRALRNGVEDELGQSFDDVRWQIGPGAEKGVGQLPPLTAEVVFYAAREAIRNAARYGRGETGRFLTLLVAAEITPTGRLQLVIADDGVGISATGGSADGSGHGLTLHSTMMAVVGGELAVESGRSGGTQVVLTLPLEQELSST